MLALAGLDYFVPPFMQPHKWLLHITSPVGGNSLSCIAFIWCAMDTACAVILVFTQYKAL
jgi:hypothetical protein